MPVRFLTGNITKDTWFQLRQTFESIVRCEEKELAKYRITAQQFLILLAIKSTYKPIKLKDAASWIDRNSNTTSAIIDRMEQDGLVTRKRDLDDRRSLRLAITRKGQKAFVSVRENSSGLTDNIMSCLSQTEISNLFKIMTKIREKTFDYRNITGKIIDINPSELL